MANIITLIIGIVLTLIGIILFKKELYLYKKEKGYEVFENIFSIITADLPFVVWYVAMIVGGILLMALAVYNSLSIAA